MISVSISFGNNRSPALVVLRRHEKLGSGNFAMSRKLETSRTLAFKATSAGPKLDALTKYAGRSCPEWRDIYFGHL